MPLDGYSPLPFLPFLPLSAMPSSNTNIDVRGEFKAVDDEGVNRLPSYEEAMNALDSTRLPGYRAISSTRYHPYQRPVLKVVNEIDRFFNTIFDEEYVPLEVPRLRRRGTQRSLTELDTDIRLRREIEEAIEFELRVSRLNTVIQDFIEGVRRAHTRE